MWSTSSGDQLVRRSTAVNMNKLKLTKRVIDSAVSRAERYYMWDPELRGFGLKVEASGTRTYVLRYRPKGLGSRAPKRFITIGRHGVLTVEQARSQAQILLGRVAKGEDPAAQISSQKEALSFEELMDHFLQEHVRPKRKQRTAEFYETLLRKHALPSLGRRSAQTVTKNDIAKLHSAMAKTPHNANRLIAAVGSLYSYAGKHSLVPEGYNPARGIEKYREEGRERYLTSEELERLGLALREGETVGIPWSVDASHPNSKHVPKTWKDRRERVDPHAVAAIRLLLFTGARLREILTARWDYVDVERGLMFLPASKTGRKTLVLNGAALDIINQLGANRGSNPFVIPGEKKEAPRADLKRPWNAIRRRAKLEGVRLHDLRHTFASVGAGSSLGLQIVGKLLGHSQPQTTARYAHLDTDPLRRAANLIGEQLASALAGPNQHQNNV